MTLRGWHLQPQLSHRGRPPTVHASVSAMLLGQVDGFLTDLHESVDAAVRRGPVRVDPEVAAYVRSLDPGTLTDADFDGLLAAAGMAGDGELAMPERRAEVNALLDLAPPELREAVLLAFSDRLSRPNRG